MGGEAMGRKPYSLLSIFSLPWGMKIKTMRIIYHTICLFRNPKAWRFYIAGIRREIF
jgi:hypothetical protein